MSGNLREMGLPELVQVLAQGRKGGKLKIRAGNDLGEIHFAEGDVVNAFCSNKQIAGVSFVGSTAIAKHVYRSCADAGKRVQALGGAKNFLAIMPDSDLDKSIANAADSAYGCSGQRCLAASVVVAAATPLRRPSPASLRGATGSCASSSRPS